MLTAKSRFGVSVTLGILAVTVSIAASGCGSGNGAGSGVVVRDSAGVEIVESHGPLWTAGEQWTVSELPIASIGSDAASEDYSLFWVMSALRLPNGLSIHPRSLTGTGAS